MSKQMMEPPKPATAEEILGMDDEIEEMLRNIADMKARALECLRTGPDPYDPNEVEKLKQEIVKLTNDNVELKKENVSLKQQIKDMWESFSAFFEKQGSKVSAKWNSFFAKSKAPEKEAVAPESSNTLTM